MNRLFLRFFVLVILSITVATIAVYFAISRLYGDPMEEIAKAQASWAISSLERVDEAPPDKWLDSLDKVRQLSPVEFDVVPLGLVTPKLNSEQRIALMHGLIVMDIPNKAFYRRVDMNDKRYAGSSEDVVHVQNLPIDISKQLKEEAIRFVIVALFLLIPIGYWSRLHWRDLQNLSRVANQFGEGKLSVRAQVPESSSIHPLAQCMNDMAQRIDLLLEAHRTLLHSVSHELRTPISRLEFGLELLRKAAKNPALDGRIGDMEGDVAELNDLVNELLSLTKMEQQKSIDSKPFSLAATLQATQHQLDHAFTERSLTLDIDPALNVQSEDVNGDPRLLARAVSNLLRNAAKYSTSKVLLRAVRLKNSEIEIAVEDDGPGIPAAEREKVFDAFYRLDGSRDRNTGGFGLGLAIARKAIELHNGRIYVTDSPLGGACFVIRVPAIPTPANPSATVRALSKST